MNNQSVSLRSLFISASSIQLATAALGTLVALKMAANGASQEAASLVAASYSLGFLVGCFYIFRPLARVGYIRAFAAGAALCALFTLLISGTESTAVLIAARLVTGLATAGLFAIGDSWINDSVAPSARGRILSLYYVALGVTSVISQIFLALYSGDLSDAFVIMAALYCIAIVVMAGTRTQPPEIAGKASLRVKNLFHDAPTALFGVFVNGFILSLLLNVMPYQASIIGLSARSIAMTVCAFYIGRILLQVPIGRLSDKFDRRVVIVAVSLVSSILLLISSFVITGDGSLLLGREGRFVQVAMIAVTVLLGGLIMPLYSLLVSHAMDRTVPVYISSTAVTMLFVYTLGSVAGPLIASLTTVIFGEGSLYLLCLAMMSGVTLYSAARIPGRVRVPRAEAAAHVVAAPTSVAMTPGRKRPSQVHEEPKERAEKDDLSEPTTTT